MIGGPEARQEFSLVPWMEKAAEAVGEGVRRFFYPSPRWERVSGEEEDQGQTNIWERESDPAYRRAEELKEFYQEHEYLARYGGEESGAAAGEESISLWGKGEQGNSPRTESGFPGQVYQLAQLEDYDFLMSHFYSVHTSTTAGRDLMNARELLSRDFRLDKTQEGPQILIYHTHAQEAFADSKEGENIVAVGSYLQELLEEKGFSVIHDQSVYDVRNGKLDRSQAYTYALEGITKILEENPGIQVVIDLHRDGVAEGTRLVTEINGKETARIMFFNGLSQTPDGPIPYLENPNREGNLAFSLQLQLKAEAYYPGFARKIYLKGLRYNLHVRPASCLVEVGAQTSTYQEARNAMEPLAEIFSMVLQGK
ncbi:MAG TPA: stage II sporulation protein P [Candidatus Cottocaccamicrobium excrementipullorum]|nr:stage II sporulation protein P [Candidatus Cottocaccamicrobium excrementipullorum]